MIALAVNHSPYALKFAPKEYRDNATNILHAASNKTEIRREDYVVDNCHDSRPIHALMYASSRLQDNIEVVATCVARHGVALQYASSRLRDDDSLVLIAVKQDPTAFKYASKQIQQTNKEVALLAAGCHKLHLKYSVLSYWTDDLDIACAAVSHRGKNNMPIFLKRFDRIRMWLSCPYASTVMARFST